MKSFFSTLTVAIMGCAVICLAAPFVKMLMIDRALAQAAAEIRAKDAASALARISPLESWALRYPYCAARLSAEIVRCHVKLGKLGAAARHAEWMAGLKTQDPASGLSVRQTGVFHYIEDVPDTLANLFMDRVRGQSYAYTWDPNAGQRVILYELERSERYDELETFARTILQGDPDNPDAKSVITYLEDMKKAPVADKPKTKRVPRDGRFVTAPAVPSQNELAAAKEKKRRYLEAQAARLEADIRAKEDAAAAGEADSDSQTDAQVEAKEKYRKLVERARSLEQEFNSCTGAKRIELMEQLRLMKHEIQRAREALPPEKPPSARPDPGILKLKKELSEVNDELRAL